MDIRLNTDEGFVYGDRRLLMARGIGECPHCCAYWIAYWPARHDGEQLECPSCHRLALPGDCHAMSNKNLRGETPP